MEFFNQKKAQVYELNSSRYSLNSLEGNSNLPYRGNNTRRFKDPDYCRERLKVAKHMLINSKTVEKPVPAGSL